MMPNDPVFGYAIGPWHRVWTSDFGWTWLRFVHRRMIQKHLYLDGGADFWWQYRRKLDDAKL